MKSNAILHGPALEQLKTLESDSVDCCVTSPPYWALRDYKILGQLGLEPTFQEYITKLIEIFNQVKRVLKKEGSCWVNMGDTYSQGDTISNRYGLSGSTLDAPIKHKADHFSRKVVQSIPQKSLCLIPERFAIAMVDEGWILRNKIIWYKPNCMPSSAKDRFTVDWEYLFFFTKSQRYYFETQYEVYDKPLNRWGGKMVYWKEDSKARSGVYFNNDKPVFDSRPNPLGRIKRAVWKIATQPFSQAHFATFAPALVKTPLLATCPEYVCRKCGKAREKITSYEYDIHAPMLPTDKYADNPERKEDREGREIFRRMKNRASISKINEHGWNECNCNAGFDGGIVLDPFMGAGTVALVALQNARNFIGIELNQSYIDMAMERLRPYLLQMRLSI